MTFAIISTIACADDSGPEPICKYVRDPSECSAWGTGGQIEDAETGDADAPALAPCVLMADGIPRTVIQCNGSLTASIAFETLLGNCASTLGDPGWCDESHDFGLGFEPYETPAVMACCDPDSATDAEVLEHCAADMIEQICRSAPTRLQMLISEGAIKVGKNQAKALRDWLNAHQQDCFDAFNVHGETPGEIEPRSWLINGGSNKQWPALKNFTIRLEAAAVTSMTLPAEESERLSCVDSEFNNTEIFEEAVPVGPGIYDVTKLAEEPEASISGPRMFGSRVVGVAKLAGSRSCVEPRCSSLAISEDRAAGVWVLEELSLFATGSVSLAAGELEVLVDGAALRLYGVSPGRIRSGSGAVASYVIEPGEAYFMVSGSSPRLRDARWATNTSPITAHRSEDGGWVLDGFSVAHVDGAGDSWTIAIPSTNWD